MALLGAIYVYLGAFLGASRLILGPSWAILGPSWAILGPSWAYLGPVLGYLGPSWAILGTSWDQERFRNPRPQITVPRHRRLGPFKAIWGPILGALPGPDRPQRSQDEPRRTTKSLELPKTCICKNLKKPLVFQGFWGSRAFQDSL